MSFKAEIKVTKDTLSPAVRRMARAVGAEGRRQVLEAMGMQLVSLTKRAFADAALRPSAWKPVKRGGQPLRRSGALWQSIRMTGLTTREVRVGTDRPYAVYHQFGTKGPYKIRPKTKKALFWAWLNHPVKSVNHPGLPARPFFPFDGSGRMIPAAQSKVSAVAESKLRALIRPTGG